MLVKRMLVPVLLGFLACGADGASSVVYNKVSAAGTVAHVVTVNMGDPDVRVSVALAAGGAGRAERFKSIVKRTRPWTAITGTFFDTRTLLPTGDIALFGTVVHSGCIGSALCIDSNNKAAIIPLKEGRKNDWRGYETVLCAGPTLVSNGKVGLALKHEGFRRVAMHGNRRTAVGITKAGKLILVCVNRNISLYRLARLMIALNAVDALTLDGGSSTALYHAGGFLAMPGRTLTNCLVVYRSPKDYQSAKSQLAPGKLLANAQPGEANTGPLAGLIPGMLPPPEPLFATTFLPRP